MEMSTEFLDYIIKIYDMYVVSSTAKKYVASLFKRNKLTAEEAEKIKKILGEDAQRILNKVHSTHVPESEKDEFLEILKRLQNLTLTVNSTEIDSKKRRVSKHNLELTQLAEYLYSSATQHYNELNINDKGVYGTIEQQLQLFTEVSILSYKPILKILSDTVDISGKDLGQAALDLSMKCNASIKTDAKNKPIQVLNMQRAFLAINIAEMHREHMRGKGITSPEYMQFKALNLKAIALADDPTGDWDELIRATASSNIIRVLNKELKLAENDSRKQKKVIAEITKNLKNIDYLEGKEASASVNYRMLKNINVCISLCGIIHDSELQLKFVAKSIKILETHELNDRQTFANFSKNLIRVLNDMPNAAWQTTPETCNEFISAAEKALDINDAKQLEGASDNLDEKDITAQNLLRAKTKTSPAFDKTSNTKPKHSRIKNQLANELRRLAMKTSSNLKIAKTTRPSIAPSL